MTNTRTTNRRTYPPLKRLHRMLAVARQARYPDLYLGSIDTSGALDFARKQYPRKAEAVCAAQCHGLIPYDWQR